MCRGLGVASSSVAICLGCFVADAKTVTELSPLLFVPQILFAGFFIKMDQIPVFLRWAQYLCSLKYAMNLILLTEFNGGNVSCNTSAQASMNCENLLDMNNIEPNMWWLSVVLMATLAIGFRVIACIQLANRATRFY